MTLSVETLLIASLMMAVFAAVSTVGSSLFLGAGYERLRAGFETIKKQTAFFSDAIHTLDGRVDAVEKQSGYFFEAINNLENQTGVAEQPLMGTTESAGQGLIVTGKDDAMHSSSENLLNGMGFIVPSAPPAQKRSLSEQFGTHAENPSRMIHFH